MRRGHDRTSDAFSRAFRSIRVVVTTILAGLSRGVALADATTYGESDSRKAWTRFGADLDAGDGGLLLCARRAMRLVLRWAILRGGEELCPNVAGMDLWWLPQCWPVRCRSRRSNGPALLPPLAPERRPRRPRRRQWRSRKIGEGSGHPWLWWRRPRPRSILPTGLPANERPARAWSTFKRPRRGAQEPTHLRMDHQRQPARLDVCGLMCSGRRSRRVWVAARWRLRWSPSTETRWVRRSG